MKVEFSPVAEADLDAIAPYIANDDPFARIGSSARVPCMASYHRSDAVCPRTEIHL